MKNRNREKKSSFILPGGIFTRNWWNYPTPNYFVGPGLSFEHFTQGTQDFTKKTRRDRYLKLPPSDFHTFTVKRVPGTYNGPGLFNYDHMLQDISSETPATPRSTLPGEKDVLEYALQLLETSNPYGSVYSVPIAIRELVDLGTMFKLTCKSFADFFGGSYLNYKFGWVSFFNDLTTLFKITKVIEQRHRDLLQLHKTGSLRKRIFLHQSKDVIMSSDVGMNYSFGASITGNLKHSKSLRVWGTVRWMLNDPSVVPLSKIQAWNLAVQQVLDLEEVDPSTAWGLLPFSWLIDYFVDISSYLGAFEGRVGLYPKDICIMREYQQRLEYVPTSTPLDVTATNVLIERSDKYRTVVPLDDFTPAITSFLKKDEWLVILALIAKFRG